MSKYVNIKVSANIGTDFYLEVADNATEEQIIELAQKQVILPCDYHKVVDSQLRRMGIMVHGIDSMLKSWNIDKIDYYVERGSNESGSEGNSETKVSDTTL